MTSRQSTLPDIIDLLGNAKWDAKALCSLIQASKPTGQLVLRMGIEHPALLDLNFKSAQPPSSFIPWAAQYGVLVKSLSLERGYSHRRFDFLAVSMLTAEASAVANALASHDNDKARKTVQLSAEALQKIKKAVKEQEGNNKDKATECLEEAQRCASEALELGIEAHQLVSESLGAAGNQMPSRQYVKLQSLDANHVSGKYLSVHNPMTRVTRLCVQLDDANAPLFASDVMPLLSGLTYLRVGSNHCGLYHKTNLWEPLWQHITGVRSLGLTGQIRAEVLRKLPAASLESLCVDGYYQSYQDRSTLNIAHLTKLTSLDLGGSLYLLDHTMALAPDGQPGVLPSSLQDLKYSLTGCNVASVVGGLTNLRSLKLRDAADGKSLADLVLSRTALPALAAVTLLSHPWSSSAPVNIDRLVCALGPRLKTLSIRHTKCRKSWSLGTVSSTFSCNMLDAFGLANTGDSRQCSI